MKVENYYCDVCGEKMESEKIKTLDVIFHTEQTEGRSVLPHLSRENICLCGSCEKKVLEGNYIHGNGAQGHNKYWFK